MGLTAVRGPVLRRGSVLPCGLTPLRSLVMIHGLVPPVAGAAPRPGLRRCPCCRHPHATSRSGATRRLTICHGLVLPPSGHVMMPLFRSNPSKVNIVNWVMVLYPAPLALYWISVLHSYLASMRNALAIFYALLVMEWAEGYSTFHRWPTFTYSLRWPH